MDGKAAAIAAPLAETAVVCDSNATQPAMLHNRSKKRGPKNGRRGQNSSGSKQKDKRWAFVKAVMNLLFPQNSLNFLTTLGNS